MLGNNGFIYYAFIGYNHKGWGKVKELQENTCAILNKGVVRNGNEKEIQVLCIYKLQS